MVSGQITAATDVTGGHAPSKTRSILLVALRAGSVMGLPMMILLDDTVMVWAIWQPRVRNQRGTADQVSLRVMT